MSSQPQHSHVIPTVVPTHVIPTGAKRSGGIFRLPKKHRLPRSLDYARDDRTLYHNYRSVPPCYPHRSTSIPVIPTGAKRSGGIFRLPSKHHLPRSHDYARNDRTVMSRPPQHPVHVIPTGAKWRTPGPCIVPTAVDPSIPLRFSRDDTVFLGGVLRLKWDVM